MKGESSADINISIDLPPVIPQKLQRAGYRFIRIIPRSKDPIDKDYPNTRNYSADDPKIVSWISHFQTFEVKDRQHEGYYVHHEGYGNYGCLCSETLIALDLDREDTIQKALSHPLLKTALSAQSGSGKGLHIWVQTDKAKTTKLSDPTTKENIGHIKAAGGYVVGPNCIHPSGGLYHIVNDGEIPFIPFEELTAFFSDYIQKRPEPTQPLTHSFTSDTIDIPIDRIMMPLKATRRGDYEIQGEHPIHGSKGGQNFSINIRKNTWHCFRCESGGGPAEAIAVAHGLIDCDDAHPGCLRGDVFKAVLEIAEDSYGWTRAIKQAPKKPEILKPIPSDDSFEFSFTDPVQKKYDALPDELPADVHVTLIDGYPRMGKTHWSELQAIKHKTANVIANTHSVLEQHLRIFRENREKGQTAVHLEGRNRCCMFKDERRSCDNCSYYPYSSNPSDRGRFLAITVETLHAKEIITKEDVMKDEKISNYCPYFFLKESAKIADYVFTVPENLEEITSDTHQTRHLTIIDEDTCFANFFPQSADLAEFVRGPSRNTVHSILETKWVGIQRWKDYLNKGKRPKGKATILRMIEILENIRDVLRIKDDEVFAPGQILKVLKEMDTTIPDPDDITKPELIKVIERWEIPDTFSKFARALLYPYKERMFTWQGHNPMKLRLIANEETRIYDPPNTKMVLIGSTRAEMFLKTMSTTWEAVRIDKFKYSKHFLFIVVKNSVAQGKSKKRTYRQNILSALKRVSHVNLEERYPLLILVGTKKEQLTVMEELGGICKGSSDENIIGQRWNYVSGCFNIFYQNSVISRGVDIPFYKCLINYSSDFASPYWTARRDVAIENRNEADLEFVESVIDAITVDETTNSTLRITPVVNNSDDVPRVVIIGERDLWKIKPGVLADAQVIELDAEQLSDNIEEVLEITGKLELLPVRKGVFYDDGKDEEWEGAFGGVRVHHYNPEIMWNKPVEERCKILADILKSKKMDTERWRKTISPHLVEATEKQVISFLIGKAKDGKTITVAALEKWMIGQTKRLKRETSFNILMSMYRRNKVRIDGIGIGAKVYLPSTYHAPEKSGVKNE